MTVRSLTVRIGLILAACIGLSLLANARLRLGGGLAIAVPLANIAFGPVFKYNGNSGTGPGTGQYMDGDTFANTWASDGVAYTMVNDTSEVNGVASSHNVAFGKTTAFDSTMVWSQVNPMTAWGTMNQNAGSPSASNKTGGLASIQGKLYVWNWRLNNGGGSSWDSTLSMSTDNGQTWSPQPQGGGLPFASVMFPGNEYVFGWVQYGQDYANDGRDNANQYVYVTTRTRNAGGTDYQPKLGRVKLANIANLSAGDYSFYTGTNGNLDGMQDASWNATIGNGVPILPVATDSTASFTQTYTEATSVQWLPRYGVYLTLRLRSLNSSAPCASCYIWDAITAPHPWGPWTIAGTSPTWNTNLLLGFPFIAPASLVNGGQQLVTLASSSNYNGSCTPSADWYCLYQVPMTLSP